MTAINWNDPHDGIDVCATHAPPMQMVESCADCVDEFNERNEVNGRMGQKVQDMVANLQRDGAMPPPWMGSEIRLETLIQMLLDPRGRAIFEAESGRRMYEALKQAQQNVTRAKIAGPQGQGGLLVPGR